MESQQECQSQPGMYPGDVSSTSRSPYHQPHPHHLDDHQSIMSSNVTQSSSADTSLNHQGSESSHQQANYHQYDQQFDASPLNDNLPNQSKLHSFLILISIFLLWSSVQSFFWFEWYFPMWQMSPSVLSTGTLSTSQNPMLLECSAATFVTLAVFSGQSFVFKSCFTEFNGRCWNRFAQCSVQSQ